MQYKIPQEIDIEDKIIGPFTLKGFGFVFATIVTALTFLAILSSFGLNFILALIIGLFFGSFFLIIGFVPFNGKPMYTFGKPLLDFLMKPRQRVWKKVIVEPKQAPQKPEREEVKKEITLPQAPIKANVDTIEDKIENLALTVDTGGTYNTYGKMKKEVKDEAPDIFSKNDPRVDMEIKKAEKQAEKENPAPEPTISEMATVDPQKKFDYKHPDTSGYKIDEVIKKENN